LDQEINLLRKLKHGFHQTNRHANPELDSGSPDPGEPTSGVCLQLVGGDEPIGWLETNG